MDFKHESNCIFLENEEGIRIAEVTFPDIAENVVNVNHTFVDGSLRGQGIAGKLMEELAKRLEKESKKAFLTCSYAITWFERSEKYKHLISKEK